MTEQAFWTLIRRALLLWMKAPETSSTLRRALGMIVSAIEARYPGRQSE